MVLLKQATSHDVATLSKAHYAVYLQARGATIIISVSNKKDHRKSLHPSDAARH